MPAVSQPANGEFWVPRLLAETSVKQVSVRWDDRFDWQMMTFRPISCYRQLLARLFRELWACVKASCSLC